MNAFYKLNPFFGTMITFPSTFENFLGVIFQRPCLHLCDVTTWQLQGWAGPSRLAEKLHWTNERRELPLIDQSEAGITPL